MKQCSHCGKQNADSTKFCTGCGKPFAQEPEAPARACPSCGAEVREGMAFCTECGAPLDKAPTPPQPPRRCPSCGAETVAHLPFCMECGATLEEDPPAPPTPPPAPPVQTDPPVRDPDSGRNRVLMAAGIVLAVLLVVGIAVGIFHLTMGSSDVRDTDPGLEALIGSDDDPDSDPAPDSSPDSDPEPGSGADQEQAASITLDVSSLYLEMGDTADITAQAEGGDVTWTVEDGSKLSLTSSGTAAQVTALDVGSTTVIAACGGAEARCVVTIYQSEQEASITLDVSSLYLEEGEMATIRAEAEGGDVTWTVEDSSKLSLTSSGATAQVIALDVGSTTVIAACGEVQARCVVTIYQTEEETEPAPDPETVRELDPDGDGYILPTDTRIISQSELHGMSREQVALARNEIYARHGHIFQTETYAAYFESQSWYTPDPNFDAQDASLLSEIELENINTIVTYEESMGWR